MSRIEAATGSQDESYVSLGLSQAFRAASRYIPRRSLASSSIVLLLACSVVSWEEYMDAGYDAHQDGRYAKSEEMFLVAAQLAESFSPDDERRARHCQVAGKHPKSAPIVSRFWSDASTISGGSFD